MENLGINAEIAKVYSFAFQQNQYPLITSIELSSSKVITPENSHETYTDLKLVLTSDPDMFSPEEWHVDSLKAGHTLLLQKRLLKISNEYLDALTEQIEINLNFSLYSADEVLATISVP